MSKYKLGQIITLKHSNIRYVCQVAKSTGCCTPCCFNDYCKKSIQYRIDSNCFYNIGTYVYKLIRKYNVEKRSNASTKD